MSMNAHTHILRSHHKEEARLNWMMLAILLISFAPSSICFRRSSSDMICLRLRMPGESRLPFLTGSGNIWGNVGSGIPSNRYKATSGLVISVSLITK